MSARKTDSASYYVRRKTFDLVTRTRSPCCRGMDRDGFTVPSGTGTRGLGTLPRKAGKRLVELSPAVSGARIGLAHRSFPLGKLCPEDTRRSRRGQTAVLHCTAVPRLW